MFCFFNKKLFFLFLILSSLLISQTQRTTFKILGVAVEGNKSADAKTIIANTGFRVGDEITIPGDLTINAIRQLWNLNIFSDVQIKIDQQVGDGVFLLVKVEEYPRIEKYEFNGNDALGNSDLEKIVTFIRGQILKPQEVERTRQLMIRKYEEEGYLNVEIDAKSFVFFTADTSGDAINVIWRNKKDLSEEYTVEYDLDDRTYSNLIEKIKDRILLRYDIVENEQIVVRNIDFIGNEAFDDSELISELKETAVKVWWKFWDGAKFYKTKFEEDKKLIEEFYKKNGYRDASIISDSLVYSDDKENVNIYIKVHEGPQYKIRNINWTGNTVYEDAILNERLGMKKGDIFNFELFNQNLRGNERQTDVASLYLDNGYLTFNLQTTETVVPPDSIDIDIVISEKNQFKIGRVDIIGNDKTKDKVIRRELFTIPSDYFNRALLFRSLQQLANLQYFNVEKLYQEGVDYNLANDSTVNVVYNVEEKSSDYLNASVGYSGAFGFSGAVGVTLTNFSIAEPFQMGAGQILSFNWQFGVGNFYRTFSLGFTEPWFLDTPTLIGFDVFDTRQQYIYDLSQTGASMRVGRRLKWPDDYFYIQGNLKFQRNNVIDGGGFYPAGKTQQITLGASLSRRNVDNPIFPAVGSILSFNAEVSGGPFLPGNVDYYKITFKSEWYKRLFGINRLVFYTIADIGYMEELVERKPTNINPFEFFYMGGSGLVIATIPLRGYDDRSVGPIVNGQVIGGRVYARYTAEVRFAVALDPIPLYVLGFAEAGRVFENINTADMFDLRRSVGVGARVLIQPVGLIGFDVGYGFDRKAIDGQSPKWVFHFQFGKGF
ncbi:MAG: outer membrane protein assembly factor BamA [Chlorobiaceae bacterium]|nr:outer membrane protein assembly factor BamA [Chlorobiaceae bacterium]MBA4310175.1 outer membrane protein assembly factor BamA [Chlorobiaceae bacterium]